MESEMEFKLIKVYPQQLKYQECSPEKHGNILWLIPIADGSEAPEKISITINIPK